METVFASDILEEAQSLAETKAYNSYSFKRLILLFNEVYRYCYEKVALIEDRFWAQTMKLNTTTTILPPFVKNTLEVYTTDWFRHPDFNLRNRIKFKPANNQNRSAPGTFLLEGTNLICADAVRREVYCDYVPEPPLLSFPFHNRDPKLLPVSELFPSGSIPANFIQSTGRYGQFRYNYSEERFTCTLLSDLSVVVDFTDALNPDPEHYRVISFILDKRTDGPAANQLAFVSYEHIPTGDWSSFIVEDLLNRCLKVRYNPFAFNGDPSMVQYVKAETSPMTGMGVTIRKQDCIGTSEEFQELGYMPDSVITFPSPVMRLYIAARLAQRLADRNSTKILEIERAVAEATFSLSMFLDKKGSDLDRVNISVGRSPSDML